MTPDWTQHLRALAEAQTWATIRLDIAKPAESLRSTELGACLTDYPDGWFYNPQNLQEIPNLILKRRELLAEIVAFAQAPAGRILCAFYGWDTQMGEGVAVSDGVIDDTYLPPWDTWFAVFPLAEVNSTEQYVLLAWIPDMLMHLVQEAMEVAATQPIAWLSDAVGGQWPVQSPGYLADIPNETRAILKRIAQALELV